MNILYADYYLPEPDTSAGALRVWELLGMMQAQGHVVSCLGQHASPPRYREALQARHIDAACDETDGLRDHPERLRHFLQNGAFDVAIVAHYDLFQVYAPFLRGWLPRCAVILDTIDVHFLRVERQAELDPSLLPKVRHVREQEIAAVRDADAVWTVTQSERDLLRELSGRDVAAFAVVPTLHRAEPDVPAFDARQGIVFLGGYKHAPNVDAVQWFMEDVLPRLRVLLPDAPVWIAGSHPPPQFDGYRALPNVEVLGFVDSHRALLKQARVGIAPLRFGAGMKGKIAEYLCCGLPCVTTGVGAEGMDFADGHDILIADDPQQFAQHIAALYENPARWNKLSQAGLAHMSSRYSPDTVAPVLTQALQTQARPRSVARRRLKLARALAQAQGVRTARAVRAALSKLGLGRLRNRILRRAGTH